MNALLGIYERMNARERILAIATVVVIGGYLLMSLLAGGEDSESSFSVTSEDVENARLRYEELVATVAEAPEVMAEFVSLVGRGDPIVDNGPRRPDLDFQNEVAEWCKQIGMPTPDFQLDREDIKDVADYEMIAVTTFIRDADMARVSRLLKLFELRGVIVQEVEVSNRLDSPSLDATIRAARIVPSF